MPLEPLCLQEARKQECSKYSLHIFPRKAADAEPAVIATVTMVICRDENHDNRSCWPIAVLVQPLIIRLG